MTWEETIREWLADHGVCQWEYRTHVAHCVQGWTVNGVPIIVESRFSTRRFPPVLDYVEVYIPAGGNNTIEETMEILNKTVEKKT